MKNTQELLDFVERFASGRWAELPDGTIEIGGDFYCYRNQLTSLPESIGNMKIGSDFYCANNQLTSLPESIGNMKIGGDFYCTNNQLTSRSRHPAKFTSFEVGNDYIYADGILWELESRRSKDGITIYKCVFGYVVSDGDTHSHGKTLRQAVSDLQFKKAKRNPDEYKDLDIREIAADRKFWSDANALCTVELAEHTCTCKWCGKEI